MQEDWNQLHATLPFVGKQFVGWLWAPQYKAMALTVACPGAGLSLYDKYGNPVMAAPKLLPLPL